MNSDISGPPAHSSMLRRLLSLAAAALAPAVAAAQAAGGIAGVETGESGPIQNARVAIESPSKAIAFTDASGKYSLRELAPGKYQLLVTSIGYKPLRRAVDVSAGAPTTVDLTLVPGSILLPGVVTSANRLPMEAAHVAATVNTLEPAQIRTSPAR